MQLNMSSHPTLEGVFKYKNHPNIISIRRFRHQVPNFNFSCIDNNAVLKEIRSLSTTKASHDTGIPANILKEISAKFICIQFNDSVKSSKCPFFFWNVLKSLLFSKINQETIKLTTDLSASYLVWKIFAKTMSNQLSTHFEKILSKFQRGFRKGFRTQHCLLLMPEKMETCCW